MSISWRNSAVFSLRLLMIAAAIGVIQLVLYLSLKHALTWQLTLVALVAAGLVAQKRSFNMTERPPLKAFLIAFFGYALPAGLLWGVFVAGVFKFYLPQVGYTPPTVFATLSGGVGVIALCQLLLSDELRRVGRSRHKQ
jgi:hypothetical protein